MRRNSKQSIGAKDPITAFAKAAISGEIPNGPHVRNACKRHLRDLKDAKRKGFYFDLDAAMRAIMFFPDLLTVEAGGETVPFEPLPWAQFVIGSIFGWKWKRTGKRRFRTAYVEGGKGCTKTPVAAGIGLYGLTADGEQSAEIYAAAAKREQAMILFNDVSKMVENAPLLQSWLRASGTNPVWQWTDLKTKSTFKPISGDKKKSGHRPHMGLVDELHEHKDNYTVNMLQKGFKGRTQPLLFIITNSGFDRTSVCWEWHQISVAVADGLKDDETHFAFVMSLDPGDEPMRDESCWPKTNPGIGITPTWEYLRKEVSDARLIPARENELMRLNFCTWTDAETGWMARATWEACEDDLIAFQKPDDLGRVAMDGGFAIISDEWKGAQAFLGVDLAFTGDLAAIAYAIPETGDDGIHRLLTWVEYFKPIATMEEAERTDSLPYRQWMKDGLIHGIPGKVIRKEHIARRLAMVSGLLDVEYAAYDRYAHKALEDEMIELGVRMNWIEHPQGFRRGGVLRDRMGNPIKDGDSKPIENPLWMPSSL